MRLPIAFLTIWALIGQFGASQAAELDIQLVHELGRLETYEGHALHAGHVWTSEGRAQETSPYRVHVFAADTEERVGTLELNHSAHYLAPYGDKSVIAIGKTSNPWRTHYSILETTPNGVRVATTFAFPIAYQVNQFGGNQSAMYFNEPGSRSIFKFQSRRLTKVGADVSMPAMMRWDDSASLLWIVESGAIGYGDENLVYLNPVTGATNRVFADTRYGLTDIELVADLGWVVASETMTDSVLFVTTGNQKLETVMQVPAGPRGIARFGKCVGVTSAEAKVVTFFALDGLQPELVASWDVSAAGDRLKSPRGIAIDPTTGKVFLRSNYLCSSCSVTQSSVFSVVDRGDVAARCL